MKTIANATMNKKGQFLEITNTDGSTETIDVDAASGRERLAKILAMSGLDEITDAGQLVGLTYEATA